MNRRDLENAVLQLMEATQDQDYQARVPFWVDLGLQDVYSRARFAFAVRAAFTTVVGGTILLPPSYLSMLTVGIPGAPGKLLPVTPDQAFVLFAGSGPATHYLIEGNLLSLLPPQPDNVRARMTYYSMLEPIVNAEDTSPYLNQAGAACLYASAAHGELYRGNPGAAQTYQSLAADRVDAINAEAASYLYGPGVQIQRVR